MENKTEHLPFALKTSWATGALGVSLMMNTVAGFALYFMVVVLKIEPAIAGTVIFVTKIFDVCTDPIIGKWSDGIKSDKGRRRPFLLFGALVSALSFAMIFTTPLFENDVLKVFYIFMGLNFFSIGYTLFNIPYLSMPSEMTDSYHERTSIHSYRIQAISVAGILGAGVPYILDVLGKTEAATWSAIGVAGAVIIFMTMFVSWAGTSKARFTKAQKEKTNILNEIGHVFKNPHFMRLIAIKFCQLFAAAATIAAFAFFVQHVLKVSFKYMSYYFLMVSVISIFIAPLLVKLSKHIGKSQAYMVSATCYIIVMGSWFFAGADEPLWAILLRGAILAIAFSGNVIMAMSMLTDIINYDSRLTGVRREGVFTSLYSFVEKFTFAFGPLVVGVALSLAGFEAETAADEVQSGSIRHALLLGMTYIPVVMGLLSIFLLAGYKLKKEDIEDKEPAYK